MKNAKWLVFESCEAPLAVKTFTAKGINKAVIRICGLGFFELKINGKKVSEDVLNPVWSDYEPRRNRRMLYPIKDTFTHRIYFREYAVTDFLNEGENRLEVLLGNGWYNQRERNVEGDFWYGLPKLCFSLKMYDGTGDFSEVVSDESMRWKPSMIVFNNIFLGEHHDYRLLHCENYAPCVTGEAPKGELCLQTCPPDKVIRAIRPRLLTKEGERAVYDAGENITGYVRFRQKGAAGEQTIVRYAENIRGDLTLDFHSSGGSEQLRPDLQQIQTDVCIGDGSENFFEPKFTWHGFRYLEVIGEAEDVEVAVVHSDVAVTSSFRCGSENLNWLYDSYIRTQLDNMHCGVPSDCPHRERLGYTGDGQMCAPAAMLLLDSKAFYEKWMRDIADCQDIESGHIQHTAPFYGGGGGPGGWGCAIVAVPYAYYKQFGDQSIAAEYLPYMHKWISYMESHSECGLVVREEKEGWCLGEWCTPDPVQLPESFINTYYLLKSLDMMIELHQALGQDAQELLEKKKLIQHSFIQAFYDAKKNSYCGGVQGADAFALDLGIGNQQMLEQMVLKFDLLGEFDTGIFGTDVLLKVLISNGYAETAFRLLDSDKRNSFGYQRKSGATTIWESWNGEGSHNHPMFGACTRHLFSGILGIQQKPDSAGYRDLVIAPKLPKTLQNAQGSVRLPIGDVSVMWNRHNDRIQFEIVLPANICGEFICEGEKRSLRGGKNTFEIPV